MADISLQLDALIADLDRLIEITDAEIALIRDARHSALNARQHEKEALLKRFERNKEGLNRILAEIGANHPGKPLHEVLEPAVQEQLEQFKRGLQRLHESNRIYGKLVATIGEFFNSLVAAILPMKEEGYKRERPRPAAFLEVSA